MNNRLTLRWLYFLFLGVFVGSLTLYGCPQNNKKEHHKTRIKKRMVKKSLPVLSQLRKNWLASTWLTKLANNSDHLKPFLGENVKEAFFKDVTALRKNQLKDALAKPIKIKKLGQLHRIWRARMHLQMAQFYAENYKWTLFLNQKVFEKRLALGKKKWGKFLNYYLGRLYCLKGDVKAGVKQLNIALSLVPKSRLDRVKAWLLVCQISQQNRRSIIAKLAKLKFANDANGWAEWMFLHYIHTLKSTVKPKITTSRTRLFASVWQHKRISLNKLISSHPIEQEEIKEKTKLGSISTTLNFFDSVQNKVLADYHAQEVIRFLASAGKMDRYAPYFRAQAYLILGKLQKEKAMLKQFLQDPPQKIGWAYLLFSRNMTPDSLILKAKLRKLRWLKASKRKAMIVELKKKAHFYPEKAIVGFGFFNLKINTNKAYKWVLGGVSLAEALERKLSTQYSVEQKKTGAAIIRQYRLYRFAWRTFYLLPARVVIRTNHPEYSLRWLERLHQKNPPYQIGDENQVAQILLTAKAYAKAGRLDVATIFLNKNRKQYPSLNQNWNLLGLLRISKGMNGPSGVKSGG